MSLLVNQLFTAQQVRANEPEAARLSGISMFGLMERAGKAVFTQCSKYYPSAQHYVILVGVGNNAGDGYIVAALAKQAGKNVTVIAADPARTLTGDAYLAQQQWLALDGDVMAYSQEGLADGDLIIDALLGTGIQSQVREPFLGLIAAANASACPVVAIDLPSGLNADTGRVEGAAIAAAITVTFVGIKQGLMTAKGRELAGFCVFEDLGIAQAFASIATPSANMINYQSSKPLPKRANNSHKGSHGKLLCLGGNAGTAGAIRLTAEAALRTGAGMVKVFTHSDSVLPVSIGRPELMVTASNLNAALEWASCIAIGPGLGQDAWAVDIFETVMDYCANKQLPVVVDADALNLLARKEAQSQLQHSVITPHPGEAARLLDSTISEIEGNRFHSVQALAKRYHSTAILKGAGTLIASNEQTWLCSDGNPALAVGGSGDVLTGIIGALLAQGLDTQQATCFGVCLHAKAGDIAAERDGERGMLPSDLFAIVRELVN